MWLMTNRIFTLSLLFVAVSWGYVAEAQKSADRKVAAELRTDITYLASDALEGRRTGTNGENLAAEYIIKRYTEIGVSPYKNNYLYPFHFVYGKEISGATSIRINGTLMNLN